MTDLDKSPAQPYVVETTGPSIGPTPFYNPQLGGGGGGTPSGANGNVQYNNNGIFGGLTDIQLTTKIQLFSPTLPGVVPASGGGTATYLRADGTWVAAVPLLASVTYSQIQNISASPRILGNVSGGANQITELTGTQVATVVDLFTSSLRGQVPGSGGGTTNFLRADGVWVSPGSSGAPGGVSGQAQFNNAGSFGGFTFTGDATVDTSTGIVTIANDAVTYAKMQNIVANNVVLGNISGASQNTAELTGTQVTALLDAFTSSLKGVVPSSGGGSVNFLRADGAWVPPPGGSGGTPGGALNTIQWNSAGTFAGFAMNGDATLVPSTGVITIANQAVTYAKMQNVSANRMLGNNTGGAASPIELTAAQVTAFVNPFTSVLSGTVPASGGGTTNFLRADGTWIAPGGAGAPGGANGQIQYNNSSAFGGFTVGGDATLNTGSGVLTIANLAVTYAKMQNVAANNRILGNVAGAAQPITELTGTQATTVLDVFTTTLKGVVPGSGGGTTNFLRADGTWVAPGGAGAPGGVTTNLQYNNAGAFGGMSGTAWDDTNRSLVRTGATITVNHPINDDTQTWNSVATTFIGYRSNFTDTNSNINSLIEDRQINGVSKWSVRKDGTVTVGAWGGTPIAAPQGGTGQNGYAIGDTLYASSTTALSKLPGNTTATKKFLSQTGTGTASVAPSWATLAPADVGFPTTTVRGGYPTWSTALGTMVDGQGILNALAYGVLDDSVVGSTPSNNRTFLQNALNTGKKVYLPLGTYTVDATLNVIGNGSGIVGDGIDMTFLQGNFASGDIIKVLDGVFFTEIADMNITRTTLGTAGSGVNIAGSAAGTTGCDGAYLHNLDVYNHNIGVTLSGQTTHGHFHKCIVAGNRSHGVVITGTILQWQLLDIFSLGNTGDGFHIVGTGGNPNPCGQWRGLGTSGNTGFAFNATHVDGLRVADCFFGDNGIVVDVAQAFDVPQHFTNVYVECGAANVNAWTITANCVSEVHLANCTGTVGGAGNGIVSASPLTMITNGAFSAHAGFGASTGSGIVITGARGSIVASSSIGFGGTGSIVASGITAVSIHACRTTGSAIITGGTGTVSNVGNY